MMKKLLMGKFYGKRWIWLALISLMTLLLGTVAYAADGTIGAVAGRVNESLTPVFKLVFAISLISGVGFTVAAVFKFKQSRDNPTQIPIGTPIALLFVGASLFFMPSIISMIGETMFGDTAQSGNDYFNEPPVIDS